MGDIRMAFVGFKQGVLEDRSHIMENEEEKQNE